MGALIDLDWISNNMFVLPFAFARYHKEMLANTKEVMEYHNGRIAIHPSFNKLITSLRTAVENGEGTLDKEATSHDFWMHFECPCSIGLATSPFQDVVTVLELMFDDTVKTFRNNILED